MTGIIYSTRNVRKYKLHENAIQSSYLTKKTRAFCRGNQNRMHSDNRSPNLYGVPVRTHLETTLCVKILQLLVNTHADIILLWNVHFTPVAFIIKKKN